jgi:uncharacterized integral membrane protein
MAEEPATVPNQRAEPTLPPDAGRDDVQQMSDWHATQGREGTGPHHKIRHTRLSGTWTAVTGFGIVLLLLLIFIVQNQNAVEVSYFGAHGHLPLGAALLLAAVAGILLVALAGSARIMQLRATVRRHRRADKKTAEARR